MECLSGSVEVFITAKGGLNLELDVRQERVMVRCSQTFGHIVYNRHKQKLTKPSGRVKTDVREMHENTIQLKEANLLREDDRQ